MKLQNHSEAFMMETQNGFRKERSCTDPTFCLKLLIEKRREFNLETHLLFIDYEKAFDNIQIQILFNILKSIHIVKDNSGYLHTNKILIKFNNKLPNRQKLIKEYTKVALFHLHCLIYIQTKWQKQEIT